MLPAAVERALKRLQADVDRETSYARRVELARASFARQNKAEDKVFRVVRSTLGAMCAGARRCMYCEDSAADEVEHHHPKNLYPDLVFVWSNYLYACGPCNGPKNNQFAVVGGNGKIVDVTRKKGAPVRQPAAGKTALIHPRSENPLDLIMLDIRGDTFLFVPSGEEGSLEDRRARYTIEVLRLNKRDYLPKARREAYYSYRARLSEYTARRDAGASEAESRSMIDAILRMQHPTVLHEMRRQRALIPELRKLIRRAPEALEW
jgi:uncharacterized protein (TIGR02646 family)